MSTAGNVPSQGVVVAEATSAKKRGDRSMGHPTSFVGKGSPGSRLKSAHRKGLQRMSLREFAKANVNNELNKELAADAKTWLENKQS